MVHFSKGTSRGSSKDMLLSSALISVQKSRVVNVPSLTAPYGTCFDAQTTLQTL